MTSPPSTGIDSFDAVINGLHKGDNVVWQVDSVEDYRHYVTPYIKKAVGMLLVQKILQQDESLNWAGKLEPHDSFYIGSDVFYSYIVENGWWNLLMKQKTKEGYFSVAPEMKENLLAGKFPNEIKERFQELIEYFGQSPIIVRSSSLLEDSFGNAFAGKYKSVFLVNQADPEQRYQMFENSVRQIFASTMDENALTYRLQRGLDEMDEQMALLVQRVSGSYHKDYFFPYLAGVGISHNTFVWEPELDPKAGMVRLVFGLGTRAVERVDDDYPQIIALDKPLRRPYAKTQDVVKFSQHKVDLLDLKDNAFGTVDVWVLLNENNDIDTGLIARVDREAERQMRQSGLSGKARPWVITFKKLLAETEFVSTMQRMLQTLERYYEYPVDVEFTTNFTPAGQMKVNLVQCRPLQTRGVAAKITVPDEIETEELILRSRGHMMGGSISSQLKRLINVDPEGYQNATRDEKYDIARLVGKLNRLTELVGEGVKYQDIVRLCDTEGENLKIMCDMLSQKVACFFS